MIREHDTELLNEEIKQFETEKEKIRTLIGQIGGSQSAKWDRIINVGFVLSLSVLFLLDLLRHILNIEVPLPALFSIELGILLVSIKIIWMIHKQIKVEHFQFWILNSIEFRLNDISKRLRNIEKKNP